MLDLAIPPKPSLTEQRANVPHTAPAVTLTEPVTPQAMRRVAGLDYSMVATGIAILTKRVNGTCLINTTTVTSKGKRADTWPNRSRRLRGLKDEILNYITTCDLVVIEGPTRALNNGGSSFDRHWGLGTVIDSLVARDIPFAIVAPAALKLAITAKGTADKAAMAGAVCRLWPDLELDNSDTTDAVGLAHLGAVRLGWSVPTLERHKQVRAEWPIWGCNDDVKSA